MGAASGCFARWPEQQILYNRFEPWLLEHFPMAEVDVQKSQITFRAPAPFCAVWLPSFGRRLAPKHCLVVTVYGSEKLEMSRVAAQTEPYPGRWTHHIPIQNPEDLDSELLDLLERSFLFKLQHSRNNRNRA